MLFVEAKAKALLRLIRTAEILDEQRNGYEMQETLKDSYKKQFEDDFKLIFTGDE